MALALAASAAALAAAALGGLVALCKQTCLSCHVWEYLYLNIFLYIYTHINTLFFFSRCCCTKAFGLHWPRTHRCTGRQDYRYRTMILITIRNIAQKKGQFPCHCPSSFTFDPPPKTNPKGPSTQ